MKLRTAKLISYLLLLLFLISLAIVSLILFPLVVFALFILASSLLAAFIIRQLYLIQKPFDSMPAEDGMRSTNDEKLTKLLETLQKTSKGKKIERH